jgi:hypothetical protein
MSELTFKNKKGEWVTYPNAEEQIEWLEHEIERLKDQQIKAENLPISDVVGQSELLVNFLWEQYKIHRIITKKAYMTMVANARKINQ